MPLGFQVNRSSGVGSTTRDICIALREDIAYGRKWGVKISAAQIFISNPHSGGIIDYDPAEFKQTIEELSEESFTVIIHGAYIDAPWRENASYSVHNIREELRAASKIGATGVIVHLSAGASDPKTFKKALKQISAGLNLEAPVTLYLEINAAKPSPVTYEKPSAIEELFNIAGEVQMGDMLSVGLCVDTAHLLSCGVVLDSAKAAREWLRGLPKVPTVLHLNDSYSEPGSGKDRHAPLTHGGIWGDYNATTGSLDVAKSGLVEILEYAANTHMLVVLERSKQDLSKDLTLLGELGYYIE